jgi:uncharacterized Zn-binding protein involved in type VI secretion
MGKPVARVGDMHTCPLNEGPIPHVGGPIIGPGAATVLANNTPLAVVGDAATCAGVPDSIIVGSATVFAENKPVAFFGAQTAHGGVIIAGSATVLVDAPNLPQIERLQRASEEDRFACEDCEENLTHGEE